MTTETLHPSITTSTDPRPLFATAVQIATPVIAGVRPDQLGLPSPCVEFDVKGVLDHLVFVLHRVAKLGRGEEAFAPGSMADDELEHTDWAADWSAAAADVDARHCRRCPARSHRRAAVGGDDRRRDVGDLHLRGHDPHVGPRHGHRPASGVGRWRLPAGARGDAPLAADGRPRRRSGRRSAPTPRPTCSSIRPSPTPSPSATTPR